MLKAGFGSVDITPPLGCGLQGYFRPRISERVHDPLFAHAVVADDGTERICLVSCDLIGIGKNESQAAVKLIGDRTGICADRIIICGTHTHTGPVMVLRNLPGWDENVDKKWMAILPHLICSSVVQASNSMAETGVACLSGFEESVSFNRRFLMKDGTVRTNPGVGNPDAVKPAGPIDPEVGILAFGRDPFSVAGVVVNFTLHLDTVGGNCISADFPGVMEGALRNVIGNGGFIYTSGAMGNINHIDISRDPSEKYGYFEHARRIGTILGAEAARTVCRMKNFSAEAVLRGGKAAVKLPLKDYDEDSVKKAIETFGSARAELNSMEYMSSVAVLRASSMGKGEFETEIAALRIGDAAFVSMPGEYFVELGLEIKKKSPFPKTFITELGLDYIGYISPREAYPQKGYEPTSSPLAPGCGEILRDAALNLLESLT